MLDCDLVVMPVHLAMHWTCAVINLRDRELLYLDSMGVRRCFCGPIRTLIVLAMVGNARDASIVKLVNCPCISV